MKNISFRKEFSERNLFSFSSMKNNILKTLSIISVFAVTGCSTPVAPLQPDNGTVSNYSVNTVTSGYSVSRLLSSRNKSRNLVTTTTSKSSASTVKKGVVTSSDGTVSINGIPFFRQGNDNTCGQAAMTSVLNYWGIDVDYQTVINDTNPNNGATDLLTIQAYMINNGLQSLIHNDSTLDLLKKIIDGGKPAIVLLDFGTLGTEHYVVVSGYNDKKGTILINDPRNGANLSMSQTDFDDKWENKSLGNLLIFGSKYNRPIVEVAD